MTGPVTDTNTAPIDFETMKAFIKKFVKSWVTPDADLEKLNRMLSDSFKIDMIITNRKLSKDIHLDNKQLFLEGLSSKHVQNMRKVAMTGKNWSVTPGKEANTVLLSINCLQWREGTGELEGKAGWYLFKAKNIVTIGHDEKNNLVITHMNQYKYDKRYFGQEKAAS